MGLPGFLFPGFVLLPVVLFPVSVRGPGLFGPGIVVVVCAFAVVGFVPLVLFVLVGCLVCLGFVVDWRVVSGVEIVLVNCDGVVCEAAAVVEAFVSAFVLWCFPLELRKTNLVH